MNTNSPPSIQTGPGEERALWPGPHMASGGAPHPWTQACLGQERPGEGPSVSPGSQPSGSGPEPGPLGPRWSQRPHPCPAATPLPRGDQRLVFISFSEFLGKQAGGDQGRCQERRQEGPGPQAGLGRGAGAPAGRPEEGILPRQGGRRRRRRGQRRPPAPGGEAHPGHRPGPGQGRRGQDRGGGQRAGGRPGPQEGGGAERGGQEHRPEQRQG